MSASSTELCVRLQRADIPDMRASLHVMVHHPQWLGVRMMWAGGMCEAEIARADFDVRERSEYIIGLHPSRSRSAGVY
jgi:adenylate cyclase